MPWPFSARPYRLERVPHIAYVNFLSPPAPSHPGTNPHHCLCNSQLPFSNSSEIGLWCMLWLSYAIVARHCALTLLLTFYLTLIYDIEWHGAAISRTLGYRSAWVTRSVKYLPIFWAFFAMLRPVCTSELRAERFVLLKGKVHFQYAYYMCIRKLYKNILTFWLGQVNKWKSEKVDTNSCTKQL